MKKSSNLKKYIFFYIFHFIINISFSQDEYFIFNLNQLKENLGPLYIESNDICKKWIPSLFNPILLTFPLDNTDGMSKKDITIKFSNPFFYLDQFEGELYEYTNNNFLGKFNGLVGVCKYPNFIDFCQIGLSFGCSNDTEGLINNQIMLNYLFERKTIIAKIFSFDKWTVLKEENKIQSTFYLGNIHKHFNSKEGIVGTCQNNKEDVFWGCSFKQMVFNKKPISLKKDNKLYKIYFSSETIDVVFPDKFFNLFKINSDSMCSIDNSDQKLQCDYSVFNNEGYIPLKLINDKMNITIEIDYLDRYKKLINSNDTKIKTNVRFESTNDNIIFPMIMFKNFHVQFDAEKDIISFYTENKAILEIEEEEEEKQSENENSSSALTVFLIILIIILIIAIFFGIFYYIRKKRGNLEKNLNRFTKFEDDDFQNMNENKVY